MTAAKGLFLSFEGIDGCGKSTAIKGVAEKFSASGRNVVLTHEPTDGTIGKKIYDILLGRRRMIRPLELQKLYVEDRKEHIEKLIATSLAQNAIVMTDRFWHSTLAYGMIDEPLEILRKLHNEILGDDFVKPDITFILDLPPEKAFARMERTRNNLDFFEKIEKQKKIRENFIALVNAGVGTIEVIDALETPQEVVRSIWKQISASYLCSLALQNFCGLSANKIWLRA